MEDYELYGYSVFETFLAHRGCYWRLDDHWHRLVTAARTFGLDPPDRDRFLADLDEYLSGPGSWSIEALSRDPRLDYLIDDPRFKAIVNKYGQD